MDKLGYNRIMHPLLGGWVIILDVTRGTKSDVTGRKGRVNLFPSVILVE